PRQRRHGQLSRVPTAVARARASQRRRRARREGRAASVPVAVTAVPGVALRTVAASGGTAATPWLVWRSASGAEVPLAPNDCRRPPPTGEAMTVGSVATATRTEGVAEKFQRVRGLTDLLASRLSPEDQIPQSMTAASPAAWHRAHTTWFFEEFV